MYLKYISLQKSFSLIIVLSLILMNAVKSALLFMLCSVYAT